MQVPGLGLRVSFLCFFANGVRFDVECSKKTQGRSTRETFKSGAGYRSNMGEELREKELMSLKYKSGSGSDSGSCSCSPRFSPSSSQRANPGQVEVENGKILEKAVSGPVCMYVCLYVSLCPVSEVRWLEIVIRPKNSIQGSH